MNIGETRSTFTIISGPKNVGIGPLYEAIAKHPDIGPRLRAMIPYSSRPIGPGEINGREAFFRTQEQIRRMAAKDPSRYELFNTPHNLVAYDLQQIDIILKMPCLIGLMVLPPEIGGRIASNPRIKDHSGVRSVFISPFSLFGHIPIKKHKGGYTVHQEALREMLAAWIKEREALLAHPDKIAAHEELKKQSGHAANMLVAMLNHHHDEDKVQRAVDRAMDDMSHAGKFKYVLKNTDWTGHPNWKRKPLLGSAGITYSNVLEILQGYSGFKAEHWPLNIFGEF